MAVSVRVPFAPVAGAEVTASPSDKAAPLESGAATAAALETTSVLDVVVGTDSRTVPSPLIAKLAPTDTGAEGAAVPLIVSAPAPAAGAASVAVPLVTVSDPAGVAGSVSRGIAWLEIASVPAAVSGALEAPVEAIVSEEPAASPATSVALPEIAREAALCAGSVSPPELEPPTDSVPAAPEAVAAGL
jgi:hypothetical protein